MKELFLVGSGGAIGAILRWLVSTWVISLQNTAFPWPTLTVNALGCFAIGIAFVLIDKNATPGLALFIIVGVFGAFTTFSTFGLDAFDLLINGKILTSLIYIISCNVGGLALVYLGVKAAQTI